MDANATAVIVVNYNNQRLDMITALPAMITDSYVPAIGISSDAGQVSRITHPHASPRATHPILLNVSCGPTPRACRRALVHPVWCAQL